MGRKSRGIVYVCRVSTEKDDAIDAEWADESLSIAVGESGRRDNEMELEFRIDVMITASNKITGAMKEDGASAM